MPAKLGLGQNIKQEWVVRDRRPENHGYTYRQRLGGHRYKDALWRSGGRGQAWVDGLSAQPGRKAGHEMQIL